MFRFDLPADLLVNVFEFADGASVLCRFAPVATVWRSVSMDAEVWRRLVARRWERLHGWSRGTISCSGCELAEPNTDCYGMQDVYFRLATLPTHLHHNSRYIALSSPTSTAADRESTPPIERLTVATFTGAELGGNQTVRANIPWSCSAAGGVHPGTTAERFLSPPIGMLRRDQQEPTRARMHAELHQVHYFEVTILPSTRDTHAPLESPCIAVGLCNGRFPLSGRMPGWDRHSLALHGDDGCKFINSSLGERYGPPFEENDVIGCGVRLRPVSGDKLRTPIGPGVPRALEVFFTRNGTLLPDPGFELGRLATGTLYACVGIDSHSPVRVNFGHHRAFRFDLRAVHPIAEPAALGLPNPPDRADYAKAIRAHLRSTLRPPVAQDASEPIVEPENYLGQPLGAALGVLEDLGPGALVQLWGELEPNLSSDDSAHDDEDEEYGESDEESEDWSDDAEDEDDGDSEAGAPGAAIQAFQPANAPDAPL